MKHPTDPRAVEDRHAPPFFERTPITVERGEGVYFWDDAGRRYMDFTSGWGVTCLGHAHPVIVEALNRQGRKVIQNPGGGLTYSPVRAELLALLTDLLPGDLNRVFFSNSGAEANDAAIKLSRKVTGRLNVVSSQKSFHGRTISTASATGQALHRERFNPLMPNYLFVPYDDLEAMARAVDHETAAVILEPVQGEGGVRPPSEGYLEGVSRLCRERGAHLIIDEVQTGFCRTGPMFAVEGLDLHVDFMTLAKGIAGGFPFGALAMTDEVSERLEKGDHGGTYCGNPLGCAVALAVIRHLIDAGVRENVRDVGGWMLAELERWKARRPSMIGDVRGRGLLLAMEFVEASTAERVRADCLRRGLLLNLTQGNVIRLFPPLNLTREQAAEGMGLLAEAVESLSG